MKISIPKISHAHRKSDLHQFVIADILCMERFYYNVLSLPIHIYLCNIQHSMLCRSIGSFKEFKLQYYRIQRLFADNKMSSMTGTFLFKVNRGNTR